eukprot:609905-Prorocentrum_minimum.AAC.2
MDSTPGSGTCGPGSPPSAGGSSAILKFLSSQGCVVVPPPNCQYSAYFSQLRPKALNPFDIKGREARLLPNLDHRVNGP